MVIKEYNHPASFLKFLEDDFSKPYENELMVGLTAKLCNDIEYYQTRPILAHLSDQNQQTTALFWTPPWPLIMYADHTPSHNLINEIMTYIHQKNIAVSGINAPMEISQLFSELWSEKTNCHINQKMIMNLYILNQLRPIQKTLGKMEYATDVHVDLLCQWAGQFLKEMDLQYENESFIRKHVKEMIQTNHAFLWIQNDKPCCMVFRERPHQKGFSIGYVYTPTKFRNKGYAKNLVHAVCQQSIESGFKYSALFADEKNSVSNHIYVSIGFKKVCTYRLNDFIYENY